MDTRSYTKDPQSNSPRIGQGIVMALYYSLVAWIPVETLYVIRNEDSVGGLTISRVIGVLLFVAAIFNRKLCFKRFPRMFWFVLWYLGVFFLSGLWIPAESVSGYFISALTFAQMFLLFVISVNLFEKSNFFESLPAFYGWWIFVVSAGMLSGMLGGEFRANSGRYSLYDQDPNVAAGLYALGAVCLIANIRKFFSIKTLFVVLAISTLIIAIFQTGSRGGMLALVAGMLAFGSCVSRKSRIMTKGVVLLTVTALLLYLLFVQFQEETIMALRLDQTLRMGDTAGRTLIWQTAWQMFLEEPWFGYGGYHNLVALGGNLSLNLRGAHNLFLEFLTSVGVVGGMPIIYALFYTLKKSWDYGRTFGNALPFSLMVTLLVVNSAITGHNQKIFWIVFAFAVAAALRDSVGYDMPRKKQSVTSD